MCALKENGPSLRRYFLVDVSFVHAAAGARLLERLWRGLADWDPSWAKIRFSAVSFIVPVLEVIPQNKNDTRHGALLTAHCHITASLRGRRMVEELGHEKSDCTRIRHP